MREEASSLDIIEIGDKVEITPEELKYLRETFFNLTEQLLSGEILLETYIAVVRSLEEIIVQKEGQRYIYEASIENI